MNLQRKYNKLQYTKDDAFNAFTTFFESITTKLSQYGIAPSKDFKVEIDELSDKEYYILSYSNGKKNFTQAQQERFIALVEML